MLPKQGRGLRPLLLLLDPAMAGYCTHRDLSLRLPFTISGNSLPSIDQANAFIDEGYHDINASLKAFGLETPFTDTADRNVVKNLNIDYALARVYDIIGEKMLGRNSEKRYSNFIRHIIRGSVYMSDRDATFIFTDSVITIQE